jgi:Domain of unknown function (DUF4275)
MFNLTIALDATGQSLQHQAAQPLWYAVLQRQEKQKMSAYFDVEPGKIIKEFSLEETARIEKDWMGVYCKNKQGCNTKAFKWHIFSAGRYPSVGGGKAIEAYTNELAAEFVVLPNDRFNAILTNEKPGKCSLSDYYVFPKNMAWVMAFTHEAGWLGPYFARHPDYDSLNAQNMALIKKANEKLAAIKKGWSVE